MKTNTFLTTIFGMICMLCFSIQATAQLQGEYTIGKGGDYETFNDAADALHSQGTFGPVTFSILPGTYTEQFVLGKINGPTESAPVIFQSQSGLTKDVELVFTPPDVDHNYVVKLSNSSHIHFKHLIFEMINLGTAISLGAGAEDINIDSCRFSGVYNTNSYEKYALICNDDTDFENIRITNNHFTNCGFGVHLAGDNYQSVRGTVAKDNQFSNIGYAAIYLAFNVAAQIEKNRILSGLYGIYAPSSSGSTSIQKNIITALQYGILIRNEGVLLSRGLIANNMLSVIGSDVKGIDIQSSTYTDVYHNSVAVSGTDPDSRAFSCAGSLVKSIKIVNNTFSALSKGYAYYIDNPSGISQSDYNNYYSAGNWLAYWDGKEYDFFDLKQAGIHDSHSLSVYPNHSAFDNLHTSSSWLKDSGTPLFAVNTDIDGEIRNSVNPDIGADENSFLSLAPLHGSYTVGTGGNYETLGEAVAELVKRGISESVTMYLTDPEYNEQIEIVNIPGSSAKNTITFTTLPTLPEGDSVVLQYSSTKQDSNFVVQLLGADFIEFNNLHLKARGTTYATVLSILGGCDSISIINNTLYATLNTNNDSRKILIDSEDSYYLKRTLENNIFREGSYGVLMRRISSYKAYPKGLIIHGNEFKNSGYAAIWLQNHEAPIVAGNIVKAGTYGIGVSQGTGAYRIEKNNVDMSSQYGIRLSANIANQLYPGIVYNNFVHVGGTGDAYGISQSSCTYLNVYYNSVNITSKDLADGRAFYSSSGSNIQIKNNIFCNTGGGYAYYVVTASAISNSDYNDIYSIGENLAYWNGQRTDLADLQSANSYHQNCLSLDPQFTAYNDLHTSEEALSGAGIVIASISDDIDGNLRHQDTPDIGADEFSGGGSALFSELVFDNPGFSAGNAIWGNFERDDDLDILACGSTRINMYHNLEDHFYENTMLDAENLSMSYLSWNDFNNDGDLDFLLQGERALNEFVTILYENTNGAFTVANEFIGLSGGQSVWKDFDNDGDQDLLITGKTLSNEGFTSLYLNDEGTFIEKTVAEQVTNGRLAVADFDKDGDLDFALSGIINNARITYIYKNTTGYFLKYDAVLPGISAGVIKWGDYDSDGDLDLLLSGYNGSSNITKIFVNDEGGFEDSGISLRPYINCDADWADYDNDGDLDFIICGRTDLGLKTMIYRNENGSFVEIDANLPGVERGSVSWGDYNRDGKPDILLNGISESGAAILKVFTNQLENSGSKPEGPSNLVAKVSLNNAELSWSSGSDNETMDEALTYNLIVGTTVDSDNILSGMVSTTGERQVVDLGNMGTNKGFKLEGLEPGFLYFWEVQSIDQAYQSSEFVAGGSFRTYESIYMSYDYLTLATVEGELDFGDFDNDGDLDLAYCGEKNDEKFTFIYENLNNTEYQRYAELIGVDQADLEWGDFDADGDLDLIVCGRTSTIDTWHDDYYYTSTILYENVGGSFENLSLGFESIRKGVVTWGDCDNDGDLDLLLSGCHRTSTRVTRLYVNQGNKTFESVAVDIEGYKYADGAWGDYDNDGDLDILLSGEVGDGNIKTEIYRNDGSYNFVALNLNLEDAKDGAVAWGDIDEDGDLDLVYTGRNNSGDTKIYNNSEIGFLEVGAQIPRYYDSSVELGDYDNDGDLDLLISGNSMGTKKTELYTNNNYFDFTPSGIEFPQFQDGFARFGDFTGDGALDIIVSGNGSTVVGLYKNMIDEKNTAPAKVENTRVSFIGKDAYLQWDRAYGYNSYGPLSYNLEIGTASRSGNIKPSHSQASGKRNINRLGNVNMCRFWPLDMRNFIESGNNIDLYWRVQSIDNGFMGSEFSEEDTIDLSGKITGVEDIPFDQGGAVLLKWQASDLDHNTSFLTYYSIWRAIPSNKKALYEHIDMSKLSMANNTSVVRTINPGETGKYWEWVANQPAHKLSEYSYACTTMNDSMPGAQNDHLFMISAHTSDPDVFFDSEPLAGYSVDNLSPYAPINLQSIKKSGTVVLNWVGNADEDLGNYLVYRSLEPNILPETLEPYANVRDLEFTDEMLENNTAYYYVVCAQDIHGNISLPSNEVSTFLTALENEYNILPGSGGLTAYPNPFKDHTQIFFDLQEAAWVNLSIYNVRGELVDAVVNKELQTGAYTYNWKKRNALPAGSYTCILEVNKKKRSIQLIISE